MPFTIYRKGFEINISLKKSLLGIFSTLVISYIYLLLPFYILLFYIFFIRDTKVPKRPYQGH